MSVRFRSAPPHEGRRAGRLHNIDDALFRSAPPHEGRRLTDLGRDALEQVSIRAPARGATHGIGALLGDPGSFDPRPRTRGDWYVTPPSLVAKAVSIRAPARGATSFGGAKTAS